MSGREPDVGRLEPVSGCRTIAFTISGATKNKSASRARATNAAKIRPIANLGQWLKRSKLAVTNLDEPLVEAFLKRKHRERGGDLRTLQQFLDHLRKILWRFSKPNVPPYVLRTNPPASSAYIRYLQMKAEEDYRGQPIRLSPRMRIPRWYRRWRW